MTGSAMTGSRPHQARPHAPAHPRERRRSNLAGFTLLELIVAIGVFAVMAAMAYGGLSAVLNTRASIERVSARTTLYQKAYLRLREDFQNGAIRGIKDENGQARPALFYDTYRQRVEFTRGGWPNPLGLPRTGFQRVAYSVDDKGRLIRESWNVLDRAPRSEPDDLLLIDGVDKFAIRFLDSKLQWQEQWPPQSDVDTTAAVPDLPLAVELRISTRDWNELRFLFQMSPNIGTQAGSTGTTQPPSGGAQ